MSDEMKRTIVGALVGAAATGVISFGLFFAERNAKEENIIETWAEVFESVNENMSLKQAIEAIYKDTRALENENSNLVNKNKELESTIDGLNKEISLLNDQIDINDENESLIDSAKTLANSNEYIKAIDILNNAEDKTPEMEALINEYKKKYETSIIKQVNMFELDEKLDEASELIKEALIVIPESSKLKSKQEDIENSYPQYMTDVVPAYQHGGNEYKEYTILNGGGVENFTMGGVKYTNGMTFDAHTKNELTWAVYNLNSQYKNLYFTVGHIDNSENGNSTTLEIYLDGYLKKEISLSSDMYPIDMHIDVNNINQLKIQVRCSVHCGHVLFGLGNPIIE